MPKDHCLKTPGFINCAEHWPGVYGPDFCTNMQGYEVACSIVLELTQPECLLCKAPALNNNDGLGIIIPSNIQAPCEIYLYLYNVTYLRTIPTWERYVFWLKRKIMNNGA
jgi:hypothetical protein